jgi:crotonobetainyl-CoA:carnitine CoA-transferase CaiB-like acyl-CoA transferase
MTLIGRADLIGTPDYAGNQQRVANSAAIDALIGDWSRRHSADALEVLLKQADIPSSKVYTAADIAADAQYVGRGMVRQVADPHFAEPVLQTGIVPHMVDAPGDVRWAGSAIGAHTGEVLSELLGLDDAGVAALRVAGVVR